MKDLLRFFRDLGFFVLELISNALRAMIGLFAVIILFFPYSAFMGIRYCCRRHRHPEEYRAAAAAARNYRAVASSRARRKKPRLMTIEQVNEKFPIMTFKQAKCERPNSMVGSIDEFDEKEQGSEEQAETSNGSLVIEEASSSKVNDTPILSEQATSKSFEMGPALEAQPEPEISEGPIEEYGEDDEDEELEVHQVDSDDTCAICIETMDDQDDVRLLKCGHIFHSECIDPWLTVRRACCPLCKADYYIPRPVEETEDGADPATVEPEVPQTESTPSSTRARLQGILGLRRNRRNDESQQSSSITRPEPAHTRDQYEMTSTRTIVAEA
jgi:hypothetical protein